MESLRKKKIEELLPGDMVVHSTNNRGSTTTGEVFTLILALKINDYNHRQLTTAKVNRQAEFFISTYHFTENDAENNRWDYEVI
jgi:hypothetical protein